jgi:hyperosmotically inducible protein
MNTSFRRAIGFLMIGALASPALAGTRAQTFGLQGSSSSFEQALPLTAEQKQVDRLLKQLASHSATVSKHADQLDSFTRGRLHYTTHATELNHARDVINAMADDLQQLRELRSNALPWQQAIIDRMGPLQSGMARNTADAIELLNAQRNTLQHGFQSQTYRDAIADLNEYSSQARNLISVNLEYAKVREKLNRLDAGSSGVTAQAPEERALTPISKKPAKSLEASVQSELLKLPYYGVFDYLAFQVDGNEVTLTGDVSWPVLKSDAERAARNVKGVERVTNHINVLPVSPQDDRIRLATYWAVYGHSSMARYRLDPNPPIRIIVENGHVTLKGAVDSEMDRNIAYLQARGVPGAFSVTNNLQTGS